MKDKIGVLRNFIKETEPERKKNKDKNSKHPKKLKIIQAFEEKLKLSDPPTKKEESMDKDGAMDKEEAMEKK